MNTRIHFLSTALVAGMIAAGMTACTTTPLIKAASAGNNEEVAQLLAAGADVNSQNGAALFETIRMNHPLTVKLLLAKGANPNTIGQLDCRDWKRSLFSKILMLMTGRTKAIQSAPVLTIASSYNQPEIVQALAEAGADIDAQVPPVMGYPCNNVTALMVASAKGHAEVVQVLVSRGARTDIRNGRFNTGKSAADFAKAARRMDIVQLLIQKNEPEEPTTTTSPLFQRP